MVDPDKPLLGFFEMQEQGLIKTPTSIVRVDWNEESI